jgi:Outer membrane protein beta-barrel domain
MKLFIVLALSLLPALTDAQKEGKFHIGFQVQPELTFYKSSYIAVYPPAHSKSSFNLGFNLYGQYQITDRLFATLGLGFISRKLNTDIDFNLALLPKPYYDTTLLGIYSNTVSYRILQIPLGLGYNFLKFNKANIFASFVFVPNFLLNEKYVNLKNYPAFKKNYWQGFSLNPIIGIDYALSKKIKLNGAIAYSLVNTVREEEYSNRHPALKHQYLQLGLGVKMKLK